MAQVPEFEPDDEARRQRFELRLLQAEAAREGELAARRSLSLAEAVSDVCAVGVVVVIDVAGATFTGHVEGVTDALLHLRMADEKRCDVVVDGLMTVREAMVGSVNAAPAPPRPSVLSTLSAVLGDAEVHGYEVLLQVANAAPVVGCVTVAGREHVELVDARNARLLVRVSAIVAVVRPESPGDAWAEV